MPSWPSLGQPTKGSSAAEAAAPNKAQKATARVRSGRMGMAYLGPYRWGTSTRCDERRRAPSPLWDLAGERGAGPGDGEPFSQTFRYTACRSAAPSFVDFMGETIARRGAAAAASRSSQTCASCISSHPPITPAPTPELLEAMHKLADREIKAGRMLDNGGLMPLADGRAGARRGRQAQRDRRAVRRGQGSRSAATPSSSCPARRRRSPSAVEFMQLHKDLMPGWEGTCEMRAFASPALSGILDSRRP